MDQVSLLVIGGLISLTSAVAILLLTHALTNRREKDKMKWDVSLEEYKSMKEDIRRTQEEKHRLEETIDWWKRWTREVCEGNILNLNYMRDTIHGISEDEHLRRTYELREVLSKLDDDEVIAISRQEKPLPTLSEKP